MADFSAAEKSPSPAAAGFPAEACDRVGVLLRKEGIKRDAEVQALEGLADARGLTLYATWHSRMAASVARAKEWLAGRQVISARIDWREDVRKWHPGQEWVFEPGGMGVFDPGINALSILTEILPAPVHLTGAVLEYPSNRQTPIAAEMQFSGGVSAGFDWRQEGPQTWDIAVDTADGARLALRRGGRDLELDGQPMPGGAALGEYPALYAAMARLVAAGQSDVDLSPMVHVADAMTLGRRVTVAAFEF